MKKNLYIQFENNFFDKIINKKRIEISEILQLTNLAENYSVTELVDNCLAKNKNKTLNKSDFNLPRVCDSVCGCAMFIKGYVMDSVKGFSLDGNKKTDSGSAWSRITLEKASFCGFMNLFL